MPYVSDKQRKYMNWAAQNGKIDPKVVNEFNKASKGLKFKRIKKSLKGE